MSSEVRDWLESAVDSALHCGQAKRLEWACRWLEDDDIAFDAWCMWVWESRHKQSMHDDLSLSVRDGLILRYVGTEGTHEKFTDWVEAKIVEEAEGGPNYEPDEGEL